MKSFEQGICEKEFDVSFNCSFADRLEMDDIGNRRLYLNDEVNSDTVEAINYHIMRYNRLDKDVAVKDRVPIKLYIDSPGGDVTSGFSLIDIIINSKTPIYTIGLGQVASMAFLIFLAGHKRYSLEHTEFLMHDGSSGAMASTAKMMDKMSFIKNMEEEVKKYIISHTKIDENVYMEKYRQEWYLYSKEAQKYGITDYILGKDCDIAEIV